MRPFLGIDISTDKKNTQVNGHEFLVQTPSPLLSNQLDNSFIQANDTIKKSTLPLPFRITQYVCGFIALFLIGGILSADVSLAQGYQNAPWLFMVAGIALILWLSLFLTGRAKAKTVLKTDESTKTFSDLNKASDLIYAELNVPANAQTVDVLSFFYIEKNGAIKVQEKALQFAQYFNPEFKAFSDANNLYLVNLDGKYAFPISSITAIHTVKKRIRIMQWNKDERLNRGYYKQFKLTSDNYGCVHCKYYHILEINHHGESFGIYIPPYELPVFETLTGLTS